MAATKKTIICNKLLYFINEGNILLAKKYLVAKYSQL